MTKNRNEHIFLEIAHVRLILDVRSQFGQHKNDLGPEDLAHEMVQFVLVDCVYNAPGYKIDGNDLSDLFFSCQTRDTFPTCTLKRKANANILSFPHLFIRGYRYFDLRNKRTDRLLKK